MRGYFLPATISTSNEVDQRVNERHAESQSGCSQGYIGDAETRLRVVAPEPDHQQHSEACRIDVKETDYCLETELQT